MAKKDTLFTYITALTSKRHVDYDKKIAGAYILSLWLSQEREFTRIVNDINKYLFVLPDEAIYKYYYHTLPTGPKYIKWTKKRPVDKKKQKIIDVMVEKYNISKQEAERSLI